MRLLDLARDVFGGHAVTLGMAVLFAAFALTLLADRYLQWKMHSLVFWLTAIGLYAAAQFLVLPVLS